MIVWLPAARVEILRIACPVLPTATGLPNGVPLSLKVTVPVGMPAPGPFAVTVAVKVTVWPKTDGAGEAATIVVVASCLTTSVRPALLPPDDALPP